MGRPKGRVLDQTDLAIIRELVEDSGISIRDIAPKVELKYSRCRRRVRWLESHGYIKYCVTVNPIMAKWRRIHYVLIKLPNQDNETVDAILEKAKTLSEVLTCDSLADDDWDFILKIVTADNERLEQIRRLFATEVRGIKTHTIDVLKATKDHRLPAEALLA